MQGQNESAYLGGVWGGGLKLFFPVNFCEAQGLGSSYQRFLGFYFHHVAIITLQTDLLPA